MLFCYWPHDEKSFHLYEINADGTGLRQLTAGPYDDIDPIYLPDGRVIYSRWEYTDKALWRIQSLWTTNQDGTGTAVFWGNQSVWPDHLAEPRPIPGEDFLVSAQPAGKGGKFLLYLMDVHGNRELIYEGAYNIWHAMPLKARQPPPAQPDRVAWPGTGKDRKTPEGGTFFSANVYQGVPDLPQGKAKALRVIQMDARTYSMWTRDGRFSGPIISALQDDGVKRILGTTPVEADGSVHFKAPAGVALHFQLLDEHGRALQTMRSFTGLMPGENRGCVGCHESHSVSSAPGEAVAAAIARTPADLVPPPWGTASISYERLVQPVLDQYCIRCHAGEGKDRAKPDLTLRPGSGVFKEPYLTLVGPVGFGLNEKNTPPGIAGALMCENYGQNNPESYVTARPMRHLSYTSKLIELVMAGKHYDVKVDAVGLQKLIAWVDANCPYRGEEEVRAIADPAFPGVERLPIPPLVKSAPVIARP